MLREGINNISIVNDKIIHKWYQISRDMELPKIISIYYLKRSFFDGICKWFM